MKPLSPSLFLSSAADYHETMVSKGFKPLISDLRLSHLNILFSRLKQVGHVEMLRDNFRQYIVVCLSFLLFSDLLEHLQNQRSIKQVTGGQIVSEVDKDGEMIPRVIEFKSKMDEVLSRAFGGSIDFYQSYKVLPVIFSSNHPFIKSSNHQIIKSSNHQIIKSSNHQIIRSSHHQIIKSSNYWIHL